jgi:hypothetical protein
LLRPIIHIVLHFAVPGLTAMLFWRRKWLGAWLVMLTPLLIDIDHLLADPIFDPNRCSLGFHPLHGWPAAATYLLLVFLPASRLLGVGFLLHLGLDGVDCLWMKW